MPLTPNAPDYVSQVRGVISDLRQNYLQKAELEQRAQIENARLALSYAQLNAQRENAQLNSQVEATRSQASALKELTDLKGERAKAESQALRDQIALQKAQLDFQDSIRKAERERTMEEQDQLAGNLQNQFQLAFEQNDPVALEEVNDKIANSLLTQAQRTQIQQNAMTAISAKRELEQRYNNMKTYEPARQIIAELNNINPGAMTPPDFEQTLGNIGAKFSALGNTDDRVMAAYDKTFQAVRKRADDYLASTVGGMTMDFTNRGDQDRLEPEWQAAYNKLLQDPRYANETSRSQSRDFALAVQGLAFKRNAQQTTALLESTAKRFAMMQEGVASNRPDTVNENGIFKYPSPDLSPTEGHYGAIDPLTGGLTQLKQKEIKDYEDYLQKLSSGSMSLQDVMAGMVQRSMGMPVSPATKPEGKSVQTQPFKPSVVFNPPTPVGKEAAVVQTPPPTTPSVSPDLINKVVNLYQSNPNAVYNGIPVRQIIARMQSDGLVSPDVLQPPRAQVVQPEKPR